MLFFPLFFCRLVFMSCQGYSCLLVAPAQHISTTVYRVCWLRARRVSGLQAPLLLRCPDGPFIPAGWEALTPSQSVKDTLGGTARPARGSVMGWIKFLLAVQLHIFIMLPFSIIVLSIISLQRIFSTLKHYCVKLNPSHWACQVHVFAKVLYYNIWRPNNKTCCQSLIKHQVDHTTPQPWPLQGEAPSAP